MNTVDSYTPMAAQQVSEAFNTAYCTDEDDVPSLPENKYPTDPNPELKYAVNTTKATIGKETTNIWNLPQCETLKEKADNPWEYLIELIRIFTKHTGTPEEYKAIRANLLSFTNKQANTVWMNKPADYDLNKLPYEFWLTLKNYSGWELTVQLYRSMPEKHATRILKEEIPTYTEIQQPCELSGLHENPAYNQIPIHWFMKLYGTHPKRIQRYLENNEHLEAKDFHLNLDGTQYSINTYKEDTDE